MTAPHPPAYHDTVPGHLKTAGQLRAEGLRPREATAPDGWWVQTFAGDCWRTELYDVHAALPTTPDPVVPPVTAPPAASAKRPVMTIVTWTKPVRKRVDGDYVETGRRAPLRVHASLDGARIRCGSDIPDHATAVTTTADWHLHTDCYNCAYRLWPDHAPDGYICPANSSDFPIRRKPRRNGP